ncbi:prepilin-type N-terminal cleavage/methylation domain-containing protein [Candidatus Kaiserbacteria bacterium]|nr:prepilin-type N-terminal cleavage/methylation domain-containing protein [Candidatus Kaiserbacteria bacterium]
MLRTLVQTNKRGFTLIELLLSVALIAAIGGIGAPVYQSFQVRNDLDVAAVTLAQTLRRAQLLSQAVDGSSTWGVSVTSGSITLFRGADYASRDVGYDEVSGVPLTITPSGVSEIVYTTITGEPQTTGTITLTASIGEMRTITLNEKGTITY